MENISAKSQNKDPITVSKAAKNSKNAPVEEKREPKHLPLWPKLVERLFSLHSFVFDKPYQMEGQSQIGATPSVKEVEMLQAKGPEQQKTIETPGN